MFSFYLTYFLENFVEFNFYEHVLIYKLENKTILIVSFVFQIFPIECVCFSEHSKKIKNSQEHEQKQ